LDLRNGKAYSLLSELFFTNYRRPGYVFFYTVIYIRLIEKRAHCIAQLPAKMTHLLLKVHTY